MPSQKILDAKKLIVNQVADRLKAAQAGVLADYRGLTVSQDTELRAKLREAGVDYAVIKNSLIRFAAEQVGIENLEPILHGPTALATSNDDVISAAKVLVDFSKENKELEIKAGFVDGKVITADEVKVYASIPSKEVLISKMLGSLQSPISALARTLQAVIDKDGTEEVVADAPAVEEVVEAAPVAEAPVEEAPVADAE
ncbi:MAG: 50S ribosomal protein L10 [Oscillospiraceae bacterium]